MSHGLFWDFFRLFIVNRQIETCQPKHMCGSLALPSNFHLQGEESPDLHFFTPQSFGLDGFSTFFFSGGFSQILHYPSCHLNRQSFRLCLVSCGTYVLLAVTSICLACYSWPDGYLDVCRPVAYHMQTLIQMAIVSTASVLHRHDFA